MESAGCVQITVDTVLFSLLDNSLERGMNPLLTVWGKSWYKLGSLTLIG